MLLISNIKKNEKMYPKTVIFVPSYLIHNVINGNVRIFTNFILLIFSLHERNRKLMRYSGSVNSCL
jgi:hypothetical protein